MSNLALWATKIASPKNSNICGKNSLIVGASATISFVIFVSWETRVPIFLPGFTKLCKRSITSPFLILTAPNSVIPSWITEKPVVSKSNDTYVASSIDISFSLKTILK